MPLISANNLVRYYDNHCAVDNISFTLSTGDILGFLGPNGAGKSTTMQMLSGNIAPSEGQISIDDIDLLDQPIKARLMLGYLPETPPLYKEMTVDEYLGFCARLHRIQGSDIKTAVALAKKRCGLNKEGRRLIANLSKGFQQRVGIAQAIVHAPKVIILDEPTVGLDPIQIREIRELIVELGKEHGIILSTHILPEVQAVCNRVQIIHQGKLVYESRMADLLNQQNTGKFEISLLRPPATDVFNQISFITDVDQLDTNKFIISTTESNAELLAKTAVENDWGLSKLISHERTLEQIFIDLTLGDGTVNESNP